MSRKRAKPRPPLEQRAGASLGLSNPISAGARGEHPCCAWANFSGKQQSKESKRCPTRPTPPAPCLGWFAPSPRGTKACSAQIQKSTRVSGEFSPQLENRQESAARRRYLGCPGLGTEAVAAPVLPTPATPHCYLCRWAGVRSSGTAGPGCI